MRLLCVGERLRELAATGCRRCLHAVDAVSVYKVITYPTRLETRIAEFSVAASQWVPKPRGVLKV